MKKDRYEISLWEDIYIQEVDGVPAHYEEEKICVIGSNSLKAQWRAREPKLVENTNGTNTLTFKIFYTYIDTETGEKKENPFLKLLVNERKVKVFWKNKWYNLIIKGIQEDSNGKSITFTCKDQYIHELSKTGFSLTFSNELMNNSGSISELGEKVLKGTDWTLISGDVIRQTVEEPVYVLSDSQVKSFTAKSIKGDIIIPAGAEILVYYSIYQNKSTYFQFHYADKYQTESNSTLIINGESCWIEEVEWDEQSVKLNGTTILTFPNSEDIRVSSIYRAKRYVKQQLQEFDALTNTYCNVYEDEDGRKVYGYIGTRTDDATVVVNLLANNGSIGFTNQEGWVQAESVKQTPGWLPQPYELSPELQEDNADEFLNGEVKSFLFFEHKSENVTGTDNEVRYLNKGVSNNTQYLEDGFSAGEKYIFRYKAAQHDSSTGKVKVGIDGKPIMFSPSSRAEAPIVPRFGKYNKNNLTILPITSGEDDYYFSSSFKGVKNNYVPTRDESPVSGKTYYTKNEKSEYISFTGTNFDINTRYYELEKWIEFKLTCNYSISKKDIYTTYFDFIFGVDRSCWLQEAQLFKETFGEDENGVEVRLEPNTINGTMIAQPEYRYYYVDETRGLTELKKEEDIGWIYVGLVDIGNFDSANDENYPNGVPKLTPIYPDNAFEKIRSIEAKNSNRFNILQTLAETFESYPVFEIKNDPETGRLIYDEATGLPYKTVTFKESIGEETGLTFVYGIDLKTISRTINSDQIVTKTIVLDNNNQYAKNGFCTIKRATDNQSKANYILNFDYYISHGLIDGGKLNMDLYDTSLGSLGLYYNLGRLNSEYDRISELKSLKKTELEKFEAQIKVYEGYLEAADEEIVKIITNIKTLTQLDTITLKEVKKWLKTNDMQEVKDYVYSWVNINNNSLQYGEILDSLERAATIVENEIKNYEKSLDNESEEEPGLLQQIEVLEEKFYKKYSRFIQEGSWNSEEYIDDNLYYLDAKSVSYTSSRPQVQYNISVLRLSSLEDFRGKIFKLGDIAAIQDTEFFGYVPSSNPKTPYKEKVLISEITSNFDSPENDSLKIQNYKTQFEDLFQRITATTQSLQYASGEYQKAAAVVESDGSIKPALIQNAISINESLMINFQNNAITQDSTGITLTDKSNPNRKVKITSGGIIFTNDGSTWKTGIDADGIRSDYLTTGSINADKIMIYSGHYPTFRWSSSGLDAYAFGENGVQFNRFVRFDQYGIYGIGGINSEVENIWKPTGESDIWDTAQFGMTWRGFFVKNHEDNGWVEVSSENDIAIFKNDLEEPKIKIGRLGKSVIDGVEKTIYGIKIADDEGHPVLITHDNGTLWLEEKLNVQTYNTQNSVQIGKLDERGYEPVDLSENGEFEEGQTYYKFDENGNFVVVPSDEAYDSTVNYYILTNEGHGGRVIDANNTFVVYEDGSIKATNGIFSGQLSAATGSFSGTLTAATGSFSGEIVATSGTIGEVEISANGLKVINSGLEIVKQEYKPYEDISGFEENKKYYILNDNGDYEEATEYQEGINYYYLTESPLLYYNENDKVLEITGDAVFSGSIGALTGTFTGEVQANSGRIGGFIIDSNQLYSEVGSLSGTITQITGEEIGDSFDLEKNYYIETEGFYKKVDISSSPIADQTYYYTDDGQFIPYVSLLGSQGKIIANNIELGTSATIKDYIKLGNSYIYNPTSANDNKFISITNEEGESIVVLTNNGKLTLGTIEIDGNTSTISIGEKLTFNGIDSTIEGGNWSITPEVASFNQIAVTNGIFKTGKIQSLGGAMLFKPATECVIDENNMIIFNNEDDTELFNENAWVILTKFNNFSTQPLKIKKVDNNLYIDSTENYKDYNVITYYCSEIGGKLQDNLIIGANSGSNTITMGEQNFLVPKAISFSEIELSEENAYPILKNKPSLVIGDLKSLDDYEGFGLYGENVYLNGTLTTKVGGNSSSSEPTYAGVNTISGVLATKFKEYKITNNKGEYDESRIVFWGGASENSDTAIQKANFQVTENGSIYANQGIFEGTLITKSTIEGSTLKATKIYGWSINENNEGGLSREAAALQIYNTRNDLGIEFWEETNDKDEHKTLSLSTNGFKVYSKKYSYIDESTNETIDIPPKENSFIDFIINEESSTVNANFNNIGFKLLSGKYLRIEDKKIGYYSQISEENIGLYKTFINFEENQVSFGIGAQDYIKYTGDMVTNTQNFETYGNVFFGTSSGKMSYQKQLDKNNNFKGYDLYIS